MTMEWIPYPENKPKTQKDCLVMCDKWGGYYKAIYFSNYDIFTLSDPSTIGYPCLHVTHYIEIPELPKSLK